MPQPSTSTSHAGATRSSCVAILLAGGAGSRFKAPQHKLLTNVPKTASRPASTVFSRSLTAAWNADIGPVIVVHGALDATSLAADAQVDATLANAAADAMRPIKFVHNPDWSKGQATSLQVGLDAARAFRASTVVVGLADQPGISEAAWQTVAAGLGPIVVATYDGRRGNPVRLDAEVWELLPVAGDEGARSLMHQRPELVTGVPCSGSPNDIDTVEDLQTWQSN